MISFVVYRKSDGFISKRISASYDAFVLNNLEDEEVFLNAPSEATHIIDNTPVCLPNENPFSISIEALRIRHGLQG